LSGVDQVVLTLHAEAWVAIASWLTLLVLGFSAAFAFLQIREARSLQEEEARPVVVVDLDVDEHPHMIYLYFKNLGKTTAHNVRLSFNPALESSVEGVEAVRFFDHVFPTLPPGKRIDSFFDTARDRLQPNATLPTSYEATVEYEDRHGKKHTDRYRLDIEALRGRTYIDKKDIEDVAKALENIATELHGWKSSYGGIKAVTESETDAKREYDEWRESRMGLGQVRETTAEPDGEQDNPPSEPLWEGV